MSIRTRRTLILLYIIAFLITCTGTALAYFMVDETRKVVGETENKSATTTSIVFNAGESLNINAEYDNFNQNVKNNLFDDTTVTATLQKGTDLNVANFHYNIKLVINANDLTYSDANKPELILSIKGPNNEELKEINTTENKLEYVTVKGNNNEEISGFDITNKVGEFPLITNQLISANDFNPVTDTWEITLTFVNLDLNQDTNIGKTFDGHIEISPVETESDVYAK